MASMLYEVLLYTHVNVGEQGFLSFVFYTKRKIPFLLPMNTKTYVILTTFLNKITRFWERIHKAFVRWFLRKLKNKILRMCWANKNSYEFCYSQNYLKPCPIFCLTHGLRMAYEHQIHETCNKLFNFSNISISPESLGHFADENILKNVWTNDLAFWSCAGCTNVGEINFVGPDFVNKKSNIIRIKKLSYHVKGLFFSCKINIFL